MNAPLLQRERPATSRTLRIFALFYLNLAFSSIEVEQGRLLSGRSQAARAVQRRQSCDLGYSPQKFGDWKELMPRVAAELAAFESSRRP